MLEDICVFETSGSCTPGDAGSGPSNLAVLTVDSQFTVCELPYVSGEGDVIKLMLMSKAKVKPCRSLSPEAGWGWWWDGGVLWQVGLWEDASPLAYLALMYEQLEAAHPPPQVEESQTMPGDKGGEKTTCYRLLKSRSAHFLQAYRGQDRRQRGCREQGWLR